MKHAEPTSFRTPYVHERISLLLKRRQGAITEAELQFTVAIFTHNSFKTEVTTALNKTRIRREYIFLEFDETSIRMVAAEFLKLLYVPVFNWPVSIPKKRHENG